MKKLLTILFAVFTMAVNAQCPTQLVPPGYSIDVWKPNVNLYKTGTSVNSTATGFSGSIAYSDYVLTFPPYPNAISYSVYWIPEAYLENASSCNLMAHQGCGTNGSSNYTGSPTLTFRYTFPWDLTYMNAHPILKDSVFYFVIFANTNVGGTAVSKGAFSEMKISTNGYTCNGCDESPACKNLLGLYNPVPVIPAGVTKQAVKGKGKK